VKRGTLWLSIIAAVAVFLVILVLRLPASWFASMLPAQVQCRELGGSIWQGECLGLQYQRAPLGDLIWNVAPLSAVRGRLAGDVDLRGSAVNLRADVDTDFSGVGELRNVIASLVLDPSILPQLPRDQRGRVAAELSRLVLASGLSPRLIQGFVELRDFRQVGAQPMELGSYRVDFDGMPASDGGVNGKVRDLGGPFALDGTLRLTPPKGYFVQGKIGGRTVAAERVVREITLGAMPDPSGRSDFSFEGSW